MEKKMDSLLRLVAELIDRFYNDNGVKPTIIYVSPKLLSELGNALGLKPPLAVMPDYMTPFHNIAVCSVVGLYFKALGDMNSTVIPAYTHDDLVRQQAGRAAPLKVFSNTFRGAARLGNDDLVRGAG